MPAKIETPLPPVCLTVAGLDPSGGAGIVADIKTFTRFGCFATAVVASVTFQNTQAVFGAVHQSGTSVKRQLDPIFDDYSVAAAKTGMLPTRSVIDRVASVFKDRELRNYVLDPVVRSTSGYDLIDDTALKAMVKRLFPLATVVTPNIPEAERITGMRIRNEKNVIAAGKRMLGLGATAVLIKGGHLGGDVARDHLFTADGHETFDSERIETKSTHGTGCILAAAITANLALGKNLSEAVRIAKDTVHDAIRSAPGLGKGNSPINI